MLCVSFSNVNRVSPVLSLSKTFFNIKQVDLVLGFKVHKVCSIYSLVIEFQIIFNDYFRIILSVKVH